MWDVATHGEHPWCAYDGSERRWQERDAAGQLHVWETLGQEVAGGQCVGTYLAMEDDDHGGGDDGDARSFKKYKLPVIQIFDKAALLSKWIKSLPVKKWGKGTDKGQKESKQNSEILRCGSSVEKGQC